MKILVIHGPNLNMLGKRDPDIYGLYTLDDVNEFITDYFKKVKLEFYQSNHEGDIVEKIQQADDQFNGVVLNAGAFTHYSYAIRDAIEGISIPVVEVHMSNIAAREDFRHNSVLSPVVMGSIAGFGAYSYVLGVQAIAHDHKKEK